jgi:hypothetical protein
VGHAVASVLMALGERPICVTKDCGTNNRASDANRNEKAPPMKNTLGGAHGYVMENFGLVTFVRRPSGLRRFRSGFRRLTTSQARLHQPR